MNYKLVGCLILIMSLSFASAAQSTMKDEARIRALEQIQVDLLLKGDVMQMEKAWLPEFTVNNPFNEIVNGHKGPIRMRNLTYSEFKRVIETIIFRADIAIVMGRESVVPNGTSANAGREIDRRFTNIWVRVGQGWKMLARHANVVCNP